MRFAVHKSAGDGLIFDRWSPANLAVSFALVLIAIAVTMPIARNRTAPIIEYMVEKPSRAGFVWILAGIFTLFFGFFTPAFVRDAFIGSWVFYSAALAAMWWAARKARKGGLDFRRGLASIGLVAASLTVGAAGLEIGVRLCIPESWCRLVLNIAEPRLLRNQPGHYSPHPYLNYYPTPDYRSSDGLERHNALGYRGAEIEIPKPDGRYRIVAVGASTTYGAGVPDWRDTYPHQLEKLLRKGPGYNDIDVINAGVGGYTSWETLVNLEFRLLDLKPDLILFYHGGTDYHSRFVPIDLYRGDNTARRKNWDDSYLASWRFHIPSQLFILIGLKAGFLGYPALETLVGGTALPIFLGRPRWLSEAGISEMDVITANRPIYFERNVRSFAAIAKTHGVKTVFLSFGYRHIMPKKFSRAYVNSAHHTKAIAEHNAILEAVAKQPGSRFFDLQAELPDDAAYWREDGVHFTKRGNQLRARLIAQFLRANSLVPGPEPVAAP